MKEDMDTNKQELPAAGAPNGKAGYLAPVREAIGLLISMVACGEDHSTKSRQVIAEAFAAIEQLELSDPSIPFAAQAVPVAQQEPEGWLYDWTHSSALGRPDEHFTSFTKDRESAFKAMHTNPRAVYAAPQPVTQPLPVAPTDLSKRLRDVGTCTHGYAQVSKADLVAACDEIARYYGGMMNWKSAAEAKDAASVQSVAEPMVIGDSYFARYTAEPVEALTDERIDELARASNLDGSMLTGKRSDYWRSFARAILAASRQTEPAQAACRYPLCQSLTEQARVADEVHRQLYTGAAPVKPWNERMGVEVGEMVHPLLAFPHMKAEILEWRERAATQPAAQAQDKQAERYLFLRDKMLFSARNDKSAVMTLPPIEAPQHDFHKDWVGERFVASVDATVDAAILATKGGAS